MVKYIKKDTCTPGFIGDDFLEEAHKYQKHKTLNKKLMFSLKIKACSTREWIHKSQTEKIYLQNTYVIRG